MKQYTFSDMNRLSGEILDHAMKSPVALTKYGKERLVILTAEDYRRLTEKDRPAAYTLENAPDEIHEELMKGLDEIVKDEL